MRPFTRFSQVLRTGTAKITRFSRSAETKTVRTDSFEEFLTGFPLYLWRQEGNHDENSYGSGGDRLPGRADGVRTGRERQGRLRDGHDDVGPPIHVAPGRW